MPQRELKNGFVVNLSTTATLLYTCPGGVRALVQGVRVCPLLTTPVNGASFTIDWRKVSPVTTINLAVRQVIALGDPPIEAITPTAPIILMPGDTIYVTGFLPSGVSSAGIADITLGVLEVVN